jgi:putative ABC transport system permease protein
MAAQQLWSNKLRSFLSLLGITIGIFCIIAVLSAVDSLEKNIMEGFNELGSDVVYIERQPWTEDPGQNYWKYLRRPEQSLRDYEAVKTKSDLAEFVTFAFFMPGGTVKYRSSSVSGTFIMGATPEYEQVQSVTLGKGRFFTPFEYHSARNLVILGAQVSDELFGDIEPIGKEIRLLGRKFQVIGVLEKEGDDPFNFLNFDQIVWMGLKTAQKFYNIDTYSDGVDAGKLLSVKAKAGVTTDELKDELTGIIRSTRRLRPYEEDNFSLNTLSMFEEVLGPVFGALNVAGFVIGIFALIVGMISVANIMFVSVKERTGLIGIKKALGARRFFILLEFLLEAIFLCLIGGVFGLLMVYGILKGLSQVIPFDMWLSMKNMVLGVSVSIIVGVISGFIPASQASKMDPVEAMRK